jgi:hypothetical protein
MRGWSINEIWDQRCKDNSGQAAAQSGGAFCPCRSAGLADATSIGGVWRLAEAKTPSPPPLQGQALSAHRRG